MNSNPIEIKINKPPKSFQNTAGVIFSCLGCVIGTGNIWRFPRIIARNSGSDGAACFFILWVVSLFTWSIPLLIVEYAIGRFLRVSPIRCFTHFMGKVGIGLGGWVTFINFFIGSYYMVILGWCLYYIYVPIKMKLPSEEFESQQIFDSFVQSNWAFIPYTMCFIFISISVSGGIKVIEKVNVILVPILLAILLGIFFYSTTLQFGEYGFDFLFSFDWKTLANPSMYLDAISQNAFDTGAALGQITAYSMYLTRSHSIMRYSLFIPIINNLVSFMASMTIFPTVFGVLLVKNPTYSQTAIIRIIKGGGLAGTGLTFIWLPILMETLDGYGRALCSIFFICLSFAGISSLISVLELQTISLMEFGIKRKWAVMIIASGMYLFGIGSVVDLRFLVNQDSVWGFSLIVSGTIYISLVIWYGPFNFRIKIVNENKSKYDFTLPYAWIFFISILAPFQALALITWWIYSEIKENPKSWYIPSWNSLITTWIEWIIFLILLVITTLFILKLNIIWVKKISLPSVSIQMTPSAYKNNQIGIQHSQYISYIESEYEDHASQIQESSFGDNF
uniref:Slc6a-24 n=1 Tax=Schmidtea mediterranea TaxID=79327 RepID=A0A0H3YJ00_SCHMD|nr:slc6a-24 [Schmidtea mediterranea]